MQLKLAEPIRVAVRKLIELGRTADGAQIRHDIARVLEGFGPYVPMRAFFGGKLTYREIRTLEATDQLETKQRSLELELEAKVKQVTPKADGGFKDEKSEQHASENSTQDLEVTMTGGDPALGMLPYRWADSLDWFPWWSVIAFDEVRPLFALLPRAELRWVADQFARDTGIVDLLSGPRDWETYAGQLQEAAARPDDLTGLSGFITPPSPPLSPAGDSLTINE